MTTLDHDLGYATDFAQENESWIGFILGTTPPALFRMIFDSGLRVEPIFENLGNLGSDLEAPIDIAIFHEGDDWYGLTIDFNTNKLYRLEFGSSLTNLPTITDMGSYGILVDPTSLEVIRELGNTYVFVGDLDGNLFQFDFGSSILSTPQIITNVISSGDRISQISFLKNCSDWHAWTSSVISNKIFELEFQEGLADSVSRIDLVTDSINSPLGLSTVIENGRNYLFVQSFEDTSSLYRFDYGSDLINTPIISDLGDLGVLQESWGLTIVNDSSEWVGFSVDRMTSRIDRIDFVNNCFANVPISEDENPQGVLFTQSGWQYISLTARDQNGGGATFGDSIYVLGSFAPDIDFSIDSSRCLVNPTFFSGISAGSITSWLWDFDDSSSASGQSVTHQFDTAGTFNVRLSVNDGTCNNTVVKPITIYNKPIPNFSLPIGSLCSNTPIPFINTPTGESGDSVTWSWDFNGEGNSSEKEPSFIFTSSGSKSITLAASIPGCNNQFDSTITILSGPQASFEFENTCFDDLTQFTNTSTGSGITGYSWIFGNGVGSTLPNPSVLYAAIGDYTVSLAVDNDLGCTTTEIDTITVHALPQADFGHDLTCRGEEIQFYDSTIVENANVDSWVWTIGSESDPADVVTYQQQNPIHQFASTGIYQARLLATSIYGCSDSVSKTLDVLESPVVDFSWLLPCEGDTVQFLDLSSGSGSAAPVGWVWNILDQALMEQNPEVFFPKADTFNVSLSVTAQNLCSVDSVKQVVINSPPQAGFLVEDACANIPTQFSDTSVSTEAIAAWEWTLAGLGQSFDQEFRFQFPAPGDYPIALLVTTETGCIDELLDTVTIQDFPDTEFEVSETIGGAPFLVEFFNNTLGASHYSWDFATGDMSTEEEPVYEFQSLGTYAVELKATNEMGCSDSFSKTVKVVNPIVDVGLDEIKSKIDQDRLQLILTISNNGTLVVKNLDVIIEVPGQLSLVENLNAPIGPDESFNYPVNFEIINSSSVTSHVCFNLVVKDPDQEELNVSDNFDCLNLDEQAVFLSAYPNPVVNQITIPMVLPAPNPVDFQLLSSDGALLVDQSNREPKIGLNLFILEIGNLRQGLYFLRTRYGAVQNTQRIVKE